MQSVLKLSLLRNQRCIKINLKILQEPNLDKIREEE